MATTLTRDGDITVDAWISFPIEKTETTEDGDLLVYGKATDGSVDSDLQIVKPQFAAKAIQDWYDSGANIRESHNPHRPVGKGLSVEHDGNATYVKSLVVDPVAKKLVAKGVLQAYSVGISRPTIERDVTGKARGGIITDGQIVEISLVDRPANKSCGIQLVKSGAAEYVDEVFGDKDMIAKMLGGDPAPSMDDFQPEMALKNFTFTPNDLAKIVKDKIIAEHYDELAKNVIEPGGYDPFAYSTMSKRDFDPGVGGGVDRDKLDESDFAGPHRSYPIVSQSDVSDALRLLHHADNPSAVRSRIAAIARRKGLKMPDDDKEAVPDEVKDQNGESGPKVSPVSKLPAAKKPGEPLESPCPPSVSKADMPETGDGDNDADDKPDIPKPKAPKSPKAAKAAKAAKPKKGKKMPPWLNKPDDGDDSASDCKIDHVHTEKCHTPPDRAAGVSGHDMQPAPVGELLESPPMASTKSESALLRLKTLGIDPDMGILHDMTCPAFHPDEVGQVYPYADFAGLDAHLWQQKALAAAAGKSLPDALEAQQAWQSVTILKTADPADLYNYRLELHKAFRDANPGPVSYPSPCAISPSKFKRPNLGGGSGHAKDSPGYGPPNTGPMIPEGAPNARSFGRPPLTAAHQSPSPSFMKNSGQYPDQQGVPTRISYAEIEKDKARRALSMMHDHLIHMFPALCPVVDQDAYRVEEPATQIPATAGVGKSEETALGSVSKYIAKLEKQVNAGVITGDEARAKLSKRTAKKYAETLSAQVQKGLTSRSEILKALGVEEPRKTEEPKPEAFGSRQGEDVIKNLSPDLMKTMMSEILDPFQARINSQDEQLANYQKALDERDALIKSLQDNQAKNDQRWEDLANRPDPGTAAFAGLALNPMRQAPAGILKQAEVSERVQGMMVRELERTARVSENPAEREAAWTALMRMQGKIE